MRRGRGRAVGFGCTVRSGRPRPVPSSHSRPSQRRSSIIALQKCGCERSGSRSSLRRTRVPAAAARALVGDPEGPGMAEVQITGRGGSQPASITNAAQIRSQNKSGMLENAIRVGAAAPASSVLAKQSLVVPYL